MRKIIIFSIMTVMILMCGCTRRTSTAGTNEPVTEAETETIGEMQFYETMLDNSGPTEYTVGANVTYIGPLAFDYSPLEKITFEGNNLKEIGKHALSMCQLREVEFPEGLEIIGDRALASNTYLERVVIPASVKEIHTCAFTECPALKEIIVYSKDVEYKENEAYAGRMFNTYENYVEGIVLEDLVIKCYKGSTTDKFANENGVKVEYLD